MTAAAAAAAAAKTVASCCGAGGGRGGGLHRRGGKQGMGLTTGTSRGQSPSREGGTVVSPARELLLESRCTAWCLRSTKRFANKKSYQDSYVDDYEETRKMSKRQSTILGFIEKKPKLIEHSTPSSSCSEVKESTLSSTNEQESVIVSHPIERSPYATNIDVDCHKENYNCENTEIEPILSGKVLASTVINVLNKHHLDLKKCVSIGTDGCSVMLGEQKGAVAELKKLLVNALKSPCYNHALNLSVSKTSKVQSVQILTYTVNLSKVLQATSIDRVTAMNMISQVLELLESKRKNVEKSFDAIYAQNVHQMCMIKLSALSISYRIRLKKRREDMAFE
nr:unnamed protein product [Callosobruchus chinensis]